MFSYNNMDKLVDHDDIDTSNLSSTNSFDPSTSSTSPPSTPSAVATEESAAAGTRLYRARLIVENHLYDQLLNRYRVAVTRLRELTREANALQEENEWLRLANEDLARRLQSLSLGSWSESVGPTASNEENNGFGGNSTTSRSSSPRSVMNAGEHNEGEGRVTLPKSISVRSPGYFKVLTPPSPSPIPSQHVHGSTKLRVRREEKAVEMEVFNQGMYKTELCNKWQETGTCPYSHHCQFAHGISELRPVIRHPRYKTQVCRMVLAGITCPYGHRCHFRHSLPATTSGFSS